MILEIETGAPRNPLKKERGIKITACLFDTNKGVIDKFGKPIKSGFLKNMIGQNMKTITEVLAKRLDHVKIKEVELSL